MAFEENSFRLELAFLVSSMPYRKVFHQRGGFERWGPDLQKWPAMLEAVMGRDWMKETRAGFKALLQNREFREWAPYLKVIFRSDFEYPERLKAIYDAPGVLWIRPGADADRRSGVSMVESRTNAGADPGSGVSRAQSPGKGLGERAPEAAHFNENPSIDFRSSRQRAWKFRARTGLPHLEMPAAGVVGTRNPQPIACIATDRLISRLPDPCLVVSGLARGVDARAHAAALRSGFSTLAVLGAGVLCPGPLSNRTLWQKEYAGKLWMLSEFAPDAPARSYHFPRRNRIIAGLSDALYLMQAPSGSGALISADFALEEGRDLFVFDHFLLQGPGMNEGGRGLLAQGAHALNHLIQRNRLHTRPSGPVEREYELWLREGMRTGKLRSAGQGWLFEV